MAMKVEFWKKERSKRKRTRTRWTERPYYCRKFLKQKIAMGPLVFVYRCWDCGVYNTMSPWREHVRKACRARVRTFR